MGRRISRRRRNLLPGSPGLSVRTPARRPWLLQGPFLFHLVRRLRRRSRVVLWILLELLLALLRAERISLAAILRLILRVLLVDFHSTNRICHHGSNSLRIFKLKTILDGPASSCRSGNSCNCRRSCARASTPAPAGLIRQFVRSLGHRDSRGRPSRDEPLQAAR